MPRPSAHDVMTDDEMDQMNAVVLQTHLYDRDVSASNKVSTVVNFIGSSLDSTPQKVMLQDINSVKQICRRYISSCLRIGVIPTKIGLSRALGHSRQSLDYWCASHPESESAHFLQIAFDAFGEILSTASLAGGCHEIVAIFLMKALYHIRENYEPPTAIQDPLGAEQLTPEEIMEKYKYLPVE